MSSSALPCAVFAAALFAAPTPSHAAGADDGPEVARSFELGVESARLPGDERMGLLSGALLFEVEPGWWLGPAVFGAASGQRGGLFVGGAQLERRWPLGARWQAFASLFAGGGGGAAAPVGGGLMLQPMAGLWVDLGGVRAGAAWSAVRFPSGQIRSSGPSLMLAWDGRYRYADASRIGAPARAEGDEGLGLDSAALVLGRYRLDDGSGRSLGLVGARVSTRAADGTPAWGLEASAAASGGAAGYMEILATTALQYELVPGLRAGVRGALGLGGGGDVPTGGGAIGKAALTLAWRPSPHWQLGVEAGRWAALDGRARATTAALWWAGDLEAPPGAPATVSGYEWSARLQHVLRARRKDGSEDALDAFGGAVDLRAGEFGYWSAQAYSAFAGGAGAYSVGLLGGGVATPARDARWTFGAELLAGAAGGGGVATGGGAIAQAQAWAGLSFGGSGRLRLGAGLVRSLRGSGGLDSPMLEIAWSQPFGLRGR